MTQEQYISLYYTVGGGKLRLISAYAPPYDRYEDEGTMWLPNAATRKSAIFGGALTGMRTDYDTDGETKDIGFLVDTVFLADGNTLEHEDIPLTLMILRTLDDLTPDERARAVDLAENGEFDRWRCDVFTELTPDEKLALSTLFADTRDYLRSIGVDCDGLIEKAFAISERTARERGWI